MSRTRLRRYLCAGCGKEFSRDKFTNQKRMILYCSIQCAQWAKRADVCCPKCGREFKRRSSGQMYCSDDCKKSARRVRPPNALLRPKPECKGCGKVLSRRGYTRCRDCAGMGRMPRSPHRKAERAQYLALMQTTEPLTDPQAAQQLSMPLKWIRGFRVQLVRAGKLRAFERIPSTGGRGGIITRWTAVEQEAV